MTGSNPLLRLDSPNSSGPTLASIIIILMLVAGAAFVFYRQFEESRNSDAFLQAAPVEKESAEDTRPFFNTSTSTELQAIEEDLQAADITPLESILEAF